MISCRPFLLTVLLLLLCAAPAALRAQPDLRITRVALSWPEVKLDVAARCDGQLLSGLDAGAFTLTEDGAPVTAFTVDCPEQTELCRTSVVLLFDVSGSMGGSGIAGAKLAGHGYVDDMRSVVDEAAVMAFASTVRTWQGMTRYRALLHNAVDSLMAGGATALWDGLYAAIEEAAFRGAEETKCEIVLSDGQDNASQRTPAEVIDLAQRHDVRVFAAQLGSSGYADLEMTALLTGGEYRKTPNAGQLEAMYADWAQIIFQCFHRCTLRYESACADGGMRDLVLRMPGLCGSGGMAASWFTAPGDTAGRPFLPMRITSVHSMARRDITVQLSLSQQVEHTNLYPSRLRITYDTASLELRGVDVPPVSLIRGVGWNTQQIPGLVQIQTVTPALMHGSGDLFALSFRTRDTQDTLCSQVAVQFWDVSEGCFQPAVAPGEVCVYPWRDEPLVSCDVSPATALEWRPARRDYVPSPFTVLARFDNNGSTTAKNGMFVVEYDRSALRRVKPDHDTIVYASADVLAGSHAAVAWDFEALHRGDAAQVPVCIRAQFDNHPDVFCCSTVDVPASGPVLLCSASAPSITALPNRGEYDPMPFPLTVTVTNAGMTTADSVRVRLVVPPELTLHAGETDEKILQPSQLGPQGQGALQWMLTHAPTPVRRQYAVEAWTTCSGADSSRCEAVVIVPALSVLDFRVTLQHAGPLDFCEGESVTLDPGTGYDRYEWSSGDTTRLLTVRQSGSYFCVLTLGGRRGYSDTVQVTAHPRPRPRLVTEGSQPLCPGDTLWVDAGADYASYNWSNGLAVRRFPATRAGTYYVDVRSAAGCAGRSDSVTVTLHPAAAVPVIVRSGDSLVTGDAAAWQWRRHGTDIPGATARGFALTETGIYTVSITDANGCTAVSAPFIVNVLGVDVAGPHAFDLLAVYPHPFRDRVEVELSLHRPGTLRIALTDLLGREVAVGEEQVFDPGPCHRSLPVGSLPAGVYLLCVEAGGERRIRILTHIR